MKPATWTIITRVFITLMGLFTTMAVGQRLGAQGLGEISLIVLGITVIMLMSNVVGGGALIYFAPRIDRRRLLPPSYAWALVTVLVAWGVLALIPIVPARHRTAVVVLAALQSLYTIHLNIVLGWEKFRTYNIISAVQSAVLLITFLVLSSQGELRDAGDYVMAAIVAFALTAALSTLALANGPKRNRRTRMATAVPAEGNLLRRLFHQGGQVQAANALQLVNYRFTYWLIEHFHGLAPLGVFSVGTQLAESSWLVPRAMGTVLYSKVSNAEDQRRQRDLTIDTFKVSVVFAIAVLLVLMLIPEGLFRSLFGKEIHGLLPILLLLAPGMVAMAASQAFSHFFSGTARNRHNMIGSGLGLVVALAVGAFVIPLYGLHGAAFVTTLAHCTNGIYQGIVFLRTTGSDVGDLFPHAGDAQRIRRMLRELARR